MNRASLTIAPFRNALLNTAGLLAVAGLFAISAGAAVAPKSKPAASPAPAPAPQIAAVPANDTDKTLQALHDELQRSRDRLMLPGQERPYYIQYRLLDVDVRSVSAEFGALLSSSTDRSRFMSVDVRVGSYKVDSSNFLSGQGFRSALTNTGTVGIDRDYNSLRQDLWLATDAAYKEGLDSLSKKRAFLRNLASAPTIDDFSQETPVVQVQPRVEPDWTNRDWDAEVKQVSAALRAYPELEDSRVTYHLIYATSYLITTEGTEIRSTKTLAAIEASMGAVAADGTPVHNYVTVYEDKPGDLPSAQNVRDQMDRAAKQLVALRVAPPVQDYDGPVLFEAPAAGSLVAQLLGPSMTGGRAPMATNTRFEQMMQSLGGRSDWTDRVGQRVLPADVNLVDDPTLNDYQGHHLIGGYGVDQEGVASQKVDVAPGGTLRQLLMSRRPGPDFDRSNGHGRSAFLADARPMMSNLFFTATDGVSPADLRKKFLDACKANGQRFGLLVRAMDNPVIASTSQDELTESLSGLATGISSGARLPLLVYRVNVDDGSETLVRGAVLSGLTTRSLRTIMGIGNDNTVYSFHQSQEAQLAGTALGMFGSAAGGVPTSVVAPSLLFEEVEVHGPHNEPRSMPIVSPPPLD